MLYTKGDTFVLACHADRALSKIGVITGKGEEYHNILKKYQDPYGIYVASNGEIMKYRMVPVKHNTSILYPVLIGDYRGWMTQEGVGYKGQ